MLTEGKDDVSASSPGVVGLTTNTLTLHDHKLIVAKGYQSRQTSLLGQRESEEDEEEEEKFYDAEGEMDLPKQRPFKSKLTEKDLKQHERAMMKEKSGTL